MKLRANAGISPSGLDPTIYPVIYGGPALCAENKQSRKDEHAKGGSAEVKPKDHFGNPFKPLVVVP